MHEVYTTIIEELQKDPTLAEKYQWRNFIERAQESANEEELEYFRSNIKAIAKDKLLTDIAVAKLGVNNNEAEEVEEIKGFGSAPVRGEGQAVTWGWEHIRDPNNPNSSPTLKYSSKERYRV